MERNRLAHPLRRSMALAILVATPLMLGADPMALFVAGVVAGILGALLFGALVRWLPPLAFALVVLPTLVAGLAVFTWPSALFVSALVGGAALVLFYRPTPPEPPRSRASPATQRRDALGRPVYVAGPGRASLRAGRVGDDGPR